MWVLSERLFQRRNRPEVETRLGFRHCRGREDECVLKRNVFCLTLVGGFSLKANREDGVSHVQHAIVQQNHTVYSDRGETRGDFESWLMSEGMRPFHRCVTQIKPDREGPSCGELGILQAVSRFPSQCSPANDSKLIRISHTFHTILASYQIVQSSIILSHGKCPCEMPPSSRKFMAFIARNGLIG